jgi:hypothetical protein
LRELESEFERHGIAVRFIVIGNAGEAARFCAKFGDPSRCVPDPEKRTYRAMGLKSFGMIGFLTNPDLKGRRAENAAAGFAQDWGETKARNVRQLPGAALIDAGGVRWLYRSKHPGDLPPMRDMLKIAIERCGGRDQA